MSDATIEDVVMSGNPAEAPSSDDHSVLAEALRRLSIDDDESAGHGSHSDHSSNAW